MFFFFLLLYFCFCLVPVPTNGTVCFIHKQFFYSRASNKFSALVRSKSLTAARLGPFCFSVSWKYLTFYSNLLHFMHFNYYVIMISPIAYYITWALSALERPKYSWRRRHIHCMVHIVLTRLYFSVYFYIMFSGVRRFHTTRINEMHCKRSAGDICLRSSERV